MPNRSWLLCIVSKRKPWKEKQIQFVVKLSKWSNDTMKTISFSATSFHNLCTAVYLLSISSSYIKRETTNVNNVLQTNTFNVHLKKYLLFFKKRVCLSLPGVAKTKSGFTLHIILFCHDWRMCEVDWVNEPSGKNVQLSGGLDVKIRSMQEDKWFVKLVDLLVIWVYRNRYQVMISSSSPILSLVSEEYHFEHFPLKSSANV